MAIFAESSCRFLLGAGSMSIVQSLHKFNDVYSSVFVKDSRKT